MTQPPTPYLSLQEAAGAERLALIDLDAISQNIARIRQLIGNRSLIAVIKADAYGHGAAPVARAALQAGADYLGLVHISEALALRQQGITGPLMAWLHTPASPFQEALAADIELGFSQLWELEAIAQAVQSLREAGKPVTARLHLKVDTGLGRNGATLTDLPALAAQTAHYQQQGLIQLKGLMTHLAVADEPTRPESQDQLEIFSQAQAILVQAGLEPQICHLANSPATLGAGREKLPAQLLGQGVRVGLGLYGLSPFADRTPQDLGLRPAMHLQTFISGLKEVPAGQGVSYGLRYQTDKPTTLALVPMGYADGVPRVADGGPVRVYPSGAEAATYRVVGRIAMDQMVLDLGAPGLSDPTLGYLGAPAVLFGAGENPPVTDWADAADTINYEIVTRISPRVTRIYRQNQA